MKNLKDYSNRYAGTITFTADVPVDTLISVCELIKQEKPEDWVDLHVRNGGDNLQHISFHQILSDGRKKTCKAAREKILGILRQEFGVLPHRKGRIPIGVKSWSMTTCVNVI